MDTKLQGMEYLITIDPKQDGYGVIYLVRNVTHICYETVQEMLDIVRVYKELWHQKEHVLLTQYLVAFK